MSPHHGLVSFVFKVKTISQHIFEFIQDFVMSCHIRWQNTSTKHCKNDNTLQIEQNRLQVLWFSWTERKDVHKMEISFSIDYGNAYLITPSRNFLKTSWPIFLKISQWGYKEYKMTNFKGRLFTRGLTHTVVLRNRWASSFFYKRVDWIK